MLQASVAAANWTAKFGFTRQWNQDPQLCDHIAAKTWQRRGLFHILPTICGVEIKL